MDALRTPDERFVDLPDYPFASHYAAVGAGLRMHYVDEGPADATPVLMLHGEPSWSYLYRHMVPVFTAAGHRALAPDLIGFGKSDKPKRVADYSYQAHVDWVREWIETLDLRGITLICQDWGSLIGLRLAAEHRGPVRPDRGRQRVPAHRATGVRRSRSGSGARSPAGPRCSGSDSSSPPASHRKLSKAERAAYDAPYPSSAYQAGRARVSAAGADSPDDPAVPANRAAWERLGQWGKPFLTLFGQARPDPGPRRRSIAAAGPRCQRPAARAAGGGHFVQEDVGEELAERTLAWM